jgi:hypothetical protein
MKSRYFLLPLLLLFSCGKKPELNIGRKEAKRPVYVSWEDLYKIENTPPRMVQSSGSMVLWGAYFLLGESLQGIHVIDRRDPANPVPLTFLSIPGCKDFTVTGTTLFVDNSNDLISIDISDIRAVKVNKVLKGATANGKNYPSNYEGYFECAAPDKGVIVDWKDTIMSNPHCQIP